MTIDDLIICATCNDAFIVTGPSQRKRKYCSRDCFFEARRAYWQGLKQSINPVHVPLTPTKG